MKISLRITRGCPCPPDKYILPYRAHVRQGSGTSVPPHPVRRFPLARVHPTGLQEVGAVLSPAPLCPLPRQEKGYATAGKAEGMTWGGLSLRLWRGTVSFLPQTAPAGGELSQDAAGWVIVGSMPTERAPALTHAGSSFVKAGASLGSY